MPIVVMGQTCPLPPLTYENIYCPSAFDLTVGISTATGNTYTWYKDGQIVRGPRAGTGSNISYNFSVTSASTAGHYYVIEQRPGFADACSYNKAIAYLETVSNLTISNLAANSVSFSWSGLVANGIYQYEILQNGNLVSSAYYYNANSATVSGLSGGTDFELRVKPQCGGGDADWSYINFTTLAGQCYVINPTTQILSNSYCTGQTVDVNYPSIIGQKYTLLKNGLPVSAIMDGTGNYLNLSFVFNGVSSVGNYSVRVSKAGCISLESPSFSVTEKIAITNLSLQWLNEVQASFIWSSPSTNGPYFYDTSSTAAVPPNPSRYTYSTNVIVDVLPGRNYYLHVKPACFTGATSAPWVSIPFSTPDLMPVNCNSISLDNCGNSTTATIEAGGGSWNFAGNYPKNSAGATTPGKEKLYSFTPAESAVYYLDVTAVQSQTEISYLYKKFSSGCSNAGWVGIKSINSVGKYAIGMLEAGTTYYILLDNNKVTAAQQSFKICKADVTTAPVSNNCINILQQLIRLVPFKEEFLIDNNGHLIASLALIDTVGYLELNSFSYRVNSLSLRRDNQNREYLDREFEMNNEFNNDLTGLKVKFYITNTELTRLINEPNDGVADVNTIEDLNVTYVNDNSCYPSIQITSNSLIGHSSAGAYSTDAWFIELPLTSTGRFYLHGGNNPLNTSCPSSPGQYLIIEEGFNMPNATLLPICWSKSNFQADISFENANIYPIPSPFEGTKCIYFNSKLYPAGAYTILNAPVINTLYDPLVDVEFYWYNSNNPLNTSNTEGVKIEYSLDNITWTLVNFVQRHDASLPVGLGQWKKKRMALPAAAGSKNNVYVRFVFISQNGDNCAMDAVRISASAACADVQNIAVTAMNGNSLTYSWSSVPAVSSYEYKVSTHFPLDLSASTTATTTASTTGLSPLSNYYLYARPICTVSNPGAWNCILVKTKASCKGENIYWNYNSPHGSSVVYRWQVNTGTGFTDISNSSIYAGATTTNLIITTPPDSYNGYQYRCAVGYSFNPPGSYFDYSDIKKIRIENTWKGTISNVWSNASNWSCNLVPTDYTDVVIPAGTSFSPQINSNTSCRSIVINNGATLNILPGFFLTLTGKQ